MASRNPTKKAMNDVQRVERERLGQPSLDSNASLLRALLSLPGTIRTSFSIVVVVVCAFSVALVLLAWKISDHPSKEYVELVWALIISLFGFGLVHVRRRSKGGY